MIKASTAEGKDLRTIVLERGLMTEEEVDKALDVEAMTQGRDVRNRGKGAGQPGGRRPAG